MHRIPVLVTLPDQIEKLARELEDHPLTGDQLLVVNRLRTHAFALAHNIEAFRTLARLSDQKPEKNEQQQPARSRH